MSQEDQKELQDLFGISDPEVGNTPHIVTFKDPQEDKEEGEPEQKGKRKRKNPNPKRRQSQPRKKRAAKPKKSVFDDNFVVPDALTPAPSTGFFDPPPFDLMRMTTPGTIYDGPSDSNNPQVELAYREEKQRKEGEQRIAKKRKQLKSISFTKLKEERKSDSDIKQEFKKIDTASEDDLDFELTKASYTQDEQFTDKFAEILRDGTGWAADFACKGEGEIKKKFEEDKSLKQAISHKISSHVGFLGLGSQIALLMGSDIYQGLNSKNQKGKVPITPQQQQSNSSKQ